MDKIWAPWRIEYIESADSDRGCFLCDAVESDNDRDNFMLYRGKESFVIMNRYPYNNGHLMIVPYCHKSDLNELSERCRDELLSLCGKSMKIISKALKSEGFNCGFNFGRVAGAGLEDHLHMHLVPRWSGDTNFFPVISDTKALPEYLIKTYDKLKDSFRALAN